MTTDVMLPEILVSLRAIGIFEKLSAQDLAAIASVTREVRFDAGQVVIRQDDPGHTLYLVLEGEVAVIKRQPEGGEIELDRIGAQDYFGEMALFEQIPRTATIRTLTPCRMLMLSKPAFDEIVPLLHLQQLIQDKPVNLESP